MSPEKLLPAKLLQREIVFVLNILQDSNNSRVLSSYSMFGVIIYTELKFIIWGGTNKKVISFSASDGNRWSPRPVQFMWIS